MKKINELLKKALLVCMSLSFFLISIDISAQRHGGRPGGLNQRGSAAQRPAIKKPANQQRPVTRPGSNGSGTKITRPSNTSNAAVRDKNAVKNRNSTKTRNSVNQKNISDRTRNDINIDRSRDINIVNNRNTIVRRNTVIYTRPPYRYGGYRYNSFHPYFYHPYTPFYWGPVWHPWGFFVATLAVTAIVVSVENNQYHYDQGVWYAPSNGGYTAVPAPVGGTVNNIPSGAQTVNTGTVNNYYYGGTYYEKDGSSYKVVAPTAGTLVESLPEGGKEVTIGDVKYIKFGETYYQPVQVDGKNKYEVVLVEEDK
ncbi:DUF6515 family protein [Flavobacterium reichenbachii]|uniref:Uncharacterized protein n=1 Tax=Flavobacterium reichenbachii TaxID=362418 RepID=A0A085ZP37_9FLAO|nr:DUF6515 family protein [Flavobacterium reichenbachii]KFF06201.1 hypothetical protein IW19_11960 [Flavobacterium reichenbachii]OXB17577.1 hypothetical protein B0A68_04610 [Flavobacterium reichenbachii]